MTFGAGNFKKTSGAGFHLRDTCIFIPLLQGWNENADRRQSVIDCSFLFLVLNVFKDYLFGYMTNGFHIIRASPQCGDSLFQVRKFFPKLERCVSFQLRSYMSRRIRGGCLDKDMNVVRHHFHLLDFPPVFFAAFKKQLFKSGFNFAYKNLSSVFWAPDNVIRNIVHTTGTCLPSFVHK